jgi:AcrR family transcriptional regulator
VAEHLRADARQNRARLLTAANEAFADKGADAPLEDIARRAGVGIGTLYRHFPTRLDLQAEVFRDQIMTMCRQADALLAAPDRPEHPFVTWANALGGYFTLKRGLSKALIEGLGRDSEVVTSCWRVMRETTERLLADAQQAGVIRKDVNEIDVMRLLHGVSVSAEHAPEDGPRLTAIVLDGLRPSDG